MTSDSSIRSSAGRTPVDPRGFRFLWASTASSNVGDGLVMAAAPLLAATLTRDPMLVAGLTVAQYLPWVLLTLASGVIVDRYDRRHLLVLGNAARALALTLLAAALVVGLAALPVLYGSVFLIGAAETLVDNAALVVLPRLVQKDGLERANGRIFATQSVIHTFVGPPLGAALFSVAATAAFLSGSLMFLAAAAAALLLPRPLTPLATPVDGSTLLNEAKAGWQYFWRHRLLRRVALMSAIVNLFGTATASVLVLLATGPLGLGAAQFGWFLSASAAGAMLGGIVAERATRLIGEGPVMMLACLLPAAECAVLATTSIPSIAAAAMFVGSFATMLSQVVVSTLRQAVVPDALMGRVTSGYRLIVLGAVPAGAVLGGTVAALLGIRAPFWLAMIGLAAAAAVFGPTVTTRAFAAARNTSS